MTPGADLDVLMEFYKAEDLRSWIIRARSGAIGNNWGAFQLLPKSEFNLGIRRMQKERFERKPTAHGCYCMASWEHCTGGLEGLGSLQQLFGVTPVKCKTMYYCPSELGFCKTEWNCGLPGFNQT